MVNGGTADLFNILNDCNSYFNITGWNICIFIASFIYCSCCLQYKFTTQRIFIQLFIQFFTK